MRKRSHLSWLMLAVFTMTILFGSSLTAFAAGPTDVQGHWAADTITKMVEAGVVTGQPDGTFKPDNKITRAEFATVIVKAFKLEAKEGKVFGDTEKHWAKAYIATANANGIVNGYSDYAFGPDDPITREQMAVMVVKAAGWKALGAAKLFPDDASISAWAKEAVATASAQGVIKGRTDGSFDPKANATRAEATVVVSGALEVKAAPEKPTDLSTLDKAGTYGPASGSQEIKGNVTIAVSGVVLQNAVITGDLFISEGVGTGEATLKNVTVKGTTTIKGGGENSIKVESCTLNKVNINKADGKLKVALSGTTTIAELIANSGVKVTGSATITKAVVYVANVVIEAKPVTSEVSTGVTASIGGASVVGTTNFTSSSSGGSSGGDTTNRVSPVIASPAAGEVAAGTQVTLTCATSGATIYYTVNGDVPSTSSTQYTGAITVNAAKTIKAIGYKSGMSNSVVATYAYTVASGTWAAEVEDVTCVAGLMGSTNVTVTIKDADAASVTKVTVNGIDITSPKTGTTDQWFTVLDGTFTKNQVVVTVAKQATQPEVTDVLDVCRAYDNMFGGLYATATLKTGVDHTTIEVKANNTSLEWKTNTSLFKAAIDGVPGDSVEFKAYRNSECIQTVTVTASQN